MKFYGALFALFATTSAFNVQPKARTPVSLNGFSYGNPTGAAAPETQLTSSLENANPAGAQSDTPPATSASPEGDIAPSSKEIWDKLSPITVQGRSLRTWSFSQPNIERVQVMMKTDGRPLNANVELWQGPDNTPQKIGVYVEDGSVRSFNAVIEAPGVQNAIAIRNTNQMEFPLTAAVDANVENFLSDGAVALDAGTKGKPEIVQGGAVKTYPFEPSVASVQVLMQTDGRPLNARIELLQGPNNNKQVLEIYTEDGDLRPFFAVIETPGVGNVIRIVNTATVEFPITTRVEPYHIDNGGISSGDNSSWGSVGGVW